jgi:4-hydroxythreonine-4-phosphate dehydrogenase
LTASAASARRSRLAVTLGDPRGIGPEVARRACTSLLQQDPELSVVMIGPKSLAGTSDAPWEVHAVGEWDGTEEGAGRVAGLAIEAATRLALDRGVGGIVTAPIHKPALNRAGWPFPGHTELLQELSGSDHVGMLMCAEATHAGRGLRVLLATTHVALRDVPSLLDRDLLVGQTTLLDDALRRDFGLDAPRIALCALNPHASDDGLFGDEEARLYAPAVDLLRSRGIDASEALPADTVFTRALRGEFDAVVAPYHDVGMAAFKTASFGRGVNVTLGLPFVRTSPDHGTAFDLAAHPGRADATSMTEAVRLALAMVRGRFDSGSADV